MVEVLNGYYKRFASYMSKMGVIYPDDPETQDALAQMFFDSLNDPQVPKVTNNVTMNLVKVDGKWKIDMSRDYARAFLNAVLGGGIVNAFMDLDD